MKRFQHKKTPNPGFYTKLETIEQSLMDGEWENCGLHLLQVQIGQIGEEEKEVGRQAGEVFPIQLHMCQLL